MYTYDYYGFGYSGGTRFNGRMRYFVEDLHKVIMQAYDDLPLFLFGHSLGAAVILDYLHFNRIRVAGVIVTSPMFVVPLYWRFNWIHQLLIEVFGTLWDVDHD